MSDIVVIKFGGTSVANVDLMRNAAQIVLAARKQDQQVVVVVSAMGDQTDKLLDLAHVASANPSERELDVIAATGEIVSSAIFATLLSDMGQAAISVTGAKAGIITTAEHTNAKIEEINPQYLLDLLKQDIVPIVAGFQGVDSNGEINTLGRGGSDTTAAALGAKLNAKECLIYTDVPGIFTTDPRVCPKARILSSINFEEILELAALGAKVLHPRAVEYAGKNKLLLRVLSTHEPDKPGTTITFEMENNMEKPSVTGIAYNVEEAKITVRNLPDTPGIAAILFAKIAELGIDVDVIVQNIGADKLADISFTVHRSQLNKAMEATKSVATELGSKEVDCNENIAKVSLVGVGMRGHAGIAAKMFKTLAEAEVNILMISTSEIKTSAIIDVDKAELAVRKLHKAFNLEAEIETGVVAPAMDN